MATTPPIPPKGFTLTIPSSVSLKDIVTLITAAVSLSLAWSTLSERITVLEKEQVRTIEVLRKLADADARMMRSMRRLEAHQQDDELLLDQVFILLKRPLPKRTDTKPPE